MLSDVTHPKPASGTVTFLFTDLEGSTGLWERYPHAMEPTLARHDAILRTAIEGANGQVVKSTGDGLMAVFPSAVSLYANPNLGAQL